MSLRLFLLKRWDDLTHLFEKLFHLNPAKPRHVHPPMTTKQMRESILESLDVSMKSFGFSLEGDLRWVRPHVGIGIDVFTVQLATKHAPEYLGVSLHVGFLVPALQNTVTKVYGSLAEGEALDRLFSGALLVRAYDEANRPKKYCPFPITYTLWNVDFRTSVIDEIKHTIKLYVIPYFDRVKHIEDLKTILIYAPDYKAALFAWFGETNSALQILNEALNSSCHNTEMKARLERLRTSIESGELQKAIEECSKITPSVMNTMK